MIFGRIVEHGLQGGDYRTTLTALARPAGVHLFAATLGSTDLLEVSFGTDLEALRQRPQAGGYTFWRPTGVFVPPRALLQGSKHRLNPVIVSPDGPDDESALRSLCTLLDEPQRPLLAVIFGQVSDPTLMLGQAWRQPRQPTRSGTTQPPPHLPLQLLRRLCLLPFWREVEAAGEIRALPLLGLDVPDTVWLVRAASLDPVIQLALALQKVTHADLKLELDPKLAGNIALGHEPTLGQADWDRTRAIGATSTVIGLPWRIHGSAVELERIVDERAPLAPTMETLVLLRGQYVSGRGATNPPSDPPTPPDVAARPGYHLLGFRDVVWRLRPRDGESTWTLGQFRSLLESLTQGNRPEAGPALIGLDTHTLLGLRPPPRPTTQDAPSRGPSEPDAALWLHQRIGTIVRGHLNPTASHPGSWISTWRAFSAGKGHDLVPQSLKTGMERLLGAVLDNLEDNLLELLDVVDVIREMVETLSDDRGTINGQDLSRIYVLIERLLLSRVRRGHPLQLQRNNLGFEGHAGYRMPRDAFGAFVRAAAKDFGVESTIVVTDFAEQAPSVHWLLNDRLIVLGVSTDTLDRPRFWVSALHELMHVVINKTPARAPFQDQKDLVRRIDERTFSRGVARQHEACREAWCDAGAIVWLYRQGVSIDSAHKALGKCLVREHQGTSTLDRDTTRHAQMPAWRAVFREYLVEATINGPGTPGFDSVMRFQDATTRAWRTASEAGIADQNVFANIGAIQDVCSDPENHTILSAFLCNLAPLATWLRNMRERAPSLDESLFYSLRHAIETVEEPRRRPSDASAQTIIAFDERSREESVEVFRALLAP